MLFAAGKVLEGRSPRSILNDTKIHLERVRNSDTHFGLSSLNDLLNLSQLRKMIHDRFRILAGH